MSSPVYGLVYTNTFSYEFEFASQVYRVRCTCAECNGTRAGCTGFRYTDGPLKSTKNWSQTICMHGLWKGHDLLTTFRVSLMVRLHSVFDFRYTNCQS